MTDNASDGVTDADNRETPFPDDDRLPYEELAVGDRFESDRTITVSRESIVDFATEYDPQPFYLEEAAGNASPFGGLVASGLQSFCLCSRLATEAFFQRIAFLGGRGVDELRWHRPVRPGDSLTVEVEIAAKRPSESTPERGDVDVDITGYDADGDRVVSWRVLGMVRRSRPADVSRY